MQIVLFYHSLLSDWNHGNAHFLRGIVTELQERGHTVEVYEPHQNWSLQNLLAEHGEAPLQQFRTAYPTLQSHAYDLATVDLDAILADADLVLVHEWNEHELVARVGAHRLRNDHYRLLFHDTHHRAVTDRASMAAYDLEHYDGVLAFGRVIRDLYLQQQWTQNAWIWHEAADVRLFHPETASVAGGWDDGAWREDLWQQKCDLIWVGNWGDDERTSELHEFLFAPVQALGLCTRVHGVRYPESARQALAAAAIDYRGWLPNFSVPAAFHHFKMTVHVPRRAYVEALPGIPTIRVFEALACGIPLVCAPWHDAEGLFQPGKDYLVAQNGKEMQEHLRFLRNEPAAACALAAHGWQTILARHTCVHRVDELLQIYHEELAG